MFFSLDTAPSLTCGVLRLERTHTPFRIELLDAVALEAPPPEPWLFIVTPSPTTPLVLDDYYPSAHLMSRRMLDVLTGAGVSNLQRFDARLTEAGTGVVHSSHQVVNVLSKVTSKVVCEGQSYVFSFEGWSPEVMIFRIASGLVVTESIALVLREVALRHLTIEPLPTVHLDGS